MPVSGKISFISGPVVTASGMTGATMYEMVRVGDEGLIGEIVRLEGESATIQVYEETSGVRPGEAVSTLGRSLSVELGPGLVGGVFDGIQRPLTLIRERLGDFIRRGVEVPALDRERVWRFTQTVEVGDRVSQGDMLGYVDETKVVRHRITVPPGVSGKLVRAARTGDIHVTDTVAEVEVGGDVRRLGLFQTWPIRIPRPFAEKTGTLTTPLITGQRIIDTFYPIAKGGTAAIPGPFGSGKTVMLQQLAKWSDADIIVYVGCGERGNEMADVLESFPQLEDPRTGEPLISRLVLVANTSNMPVAAREASIYTGITMAEYFRDMGYNVALMADSTSRWAEALREVSGRLGEMPGEEGYPAYLASRLADFYERSGKVRALGRPEREGSVSIMGAVSPPGGDFSEPVTQNTLRITKVFWALDERLAYRRHYPAIDWLRSYSLYLDGVTDWASRSLSPLWRKLRDDAMTLLQKESELMEIVQLVGPDALPERDRLILEAAKYIRESFLQQSAFSEIDTFCPVERQLKMLRTILEYYELAKLVMERGVKLEQIVSLSSPKTLPRMKMVSREEFDGFLSRLSESMRKEFEAISTKAEA